MKIGIDIDDTLVDTSASFNKVIKKYNVNFKKSFHDKWTQDEVEFIFKNYLKEIIFSAKFKAGAKDALKRLSDLGHELIIITARNEKNCNGIEQYTKKILTDINISKYYFGESIKSNIAKKENLDLMIDDSMEVYKNMKSENINCILFGDKIKTWNQILKYIEKEDNHG